MIFAQHPRVDKDHRTIVKYLLNIYVYITSLKVLIKISIFLTNNNPSNMGYEIYFKSKSLTHLYTSNRIIFHIIVRNKKFTHLKLGIARHTERG